MSNWDKKKLSEICGFVRGPFGGSLKKSIFRSEGYAVYEQQHAIYDQFDVVRYFIDENKFNEMKRFELNPGDLIMSCSGTMGKISIVPKNIKKGIINQALLKLSPSNKVSAVFLKLWMQSESFQDSLKKYSGGAAIQNVASVAILKQIEIPLPSLHEQQRIVSILDEAFAAIAKAKQNAEKNLQNVKELFETVLQSVFENKGEGWEEKKLSEVCELINGRAYNKQELLPKGKYTVLRVGNLFTNKHWYYSDLELPENKYCQFGDLLYCWSASFGPTVWQGEKVIYHYHIWKVIPNENLVTKEFLFTLFNWDKEKIKASQGTGTTMMHVSKGSMEERVVPLPPLPEQLAIVKKLTAISNETKRLEAIYKQKLSNLEELKKTILQKAFAGELKGIETAIAV